MARDAEGVPCPLRSACLGRTASGTRGRRVSAVRQRRLTEVVLHPRPSAAEAAMRWNASAGRELRRAWMAHWPQHTVTVAALPAGLSPPARPPRAARSHRRLGWQERLGRNARGPLLVTSIQLTGVAQRVRDLLHPREYDSPLRAQLVEIRNPGTPDQGQRDLRCMSTPDAFA
jgi:hypothetical protein